MGTRKTKTRGASPKAILFQRLSEQPSGVLLELLGAAYEALDQRQRQSVFGDYLQPETPLAAGDGKRLLREIKRFHGDSLAAIASPEDYATVAVSLLKRDSRQSFADGVFVSAMRAANKVQKVHLAAEIERQRVPTKPDKSPQRPRGRK